jgi:putative Holliday junction resolvase
VSPGRILAIDYGERRVGFARSDALGLTAQPMETFQRRTGSDLMAHIRRLVATYAVSRIVVGHPVNMDGSRGPKALEAEAFADSLRAVVSVPVELWDERLTSHQAESILSEAGIPRRKQREGGRVDCLAAQILLRAYMDARQS